MTSSAYDNSLSPDKNRSKLPYVRTKCLAKVMLKRMLFHKTHSTLEDWETFLGEFVIILSWLVHLCEAGTNLVAGCARLVGGGGGKGGTFY